MVTSAKKTRHKKFTNRELASTLKKARAKMNDSGAHWVKRLFSVRKKDVGMCYCALGAIGAVTPAGTALNSAASRALYELGMGGKYGTYTSRRLSHMTEDARGAVMAKNDSMATRWHDIDRVYEKAITALEAGAELRDPTG